MTGTAYRAPFTSTTHTETCAAVARMQRNAEEARTRNPRAIFVSEWTELDRDQAIALIDGGSHRECQRCAKIRGIKGLEERTRPAEVQAEIDAIQATAMTVQTYRIYNAGYVTPKTTNDLTSAGKYAQEMSRTTGASSLIADKETGKTIGGCDIDPQTGLPISYWL